MNLKFTCPTCKTKFKADPEGRDFVLCPNCQSRLLVPPEVLDAIATAQNAPKRRRLGEGGWLLAAVAGFVLLWVTIAFVLYVSRPSEPTQTAVAPAPAPPIRSAPPPVQEEPPQPVAPTPPPSTTPASKPAMRPRPTFKLGVSPSSITDKQIEASIRKGVGHVLQQFRNYELREGIMDNETGRQGLNALMVYSLLHCSQFINDPAISIKSEGMRMMIERMKKHEMQAGEVPRQPVTYGRSLRACALAVYNRNEDKEALNRDVQWLISASCGGGYEYDDYFIRPAPPSRPGDKAAPTPVAPANRPGVHPPQPFSPDNSNSQYGLIGVWTAAESGVSVPQSFWDAVEKYWTNGQCADGTWGYNPPGGASGTYAMTLAGITALAVARDYLPAGSGTSSAESRDAAGQALERALVWFAKHAVRIEEGVQWGYSLYGLERAALATGMMYAGGHDLYRELAAKIIAEQRPSGAWKGDDGQDALVDSCFALLFLSRGRNPVMMNKLSYDGKWDLRPRDLSLLTRYCSYAMERPMNWQTVSIHQDWQQWLDAPILYISGSTSVEFSETDIDKLRSYANAGGLIFTHADNGSKEFTASIERLADKLFPDSKLQDVPPDDDVYGMVFPVSAQQYPLKMVTRGARRLLIHSTKDISVGWVSRAGQMRQNSSRLAINLVVFASGRGPLRGRAESHYVPPASPEAVYRFSVARVKYDGNWNPEPYAWDRLANLLGWQMSWGVDVLPMETKQLDPFAMPFAHLTGVDAISLSDEQIHDLRQYVQRGGVLLIDPCGGKPRLSLEIQQKLIPALFPGTPVRKLAEDHPIRTGALKELSEAAAALPKPNLRPYSSQIIKPADAELSQVAYGKGICLIAPLDVATGLLGTDTWNVNGYEPEYAIPLVRNILLYSALREVTP